MASEINLIIITTVPVLNGNSAAASRIKNYANGFDGRQVVICNPEDGIYNWTANEILKSIWRNKYFEKTIFYYIYFLLVLVHILKLNKIKNLRHFVYPSTITSLDYAILLVLKLFFNYKIVYEVNELRSAAIANRTYSSNPIKYLFEIGIYLFDSFNFYMVEKLTRFYDGLIVISDSLRVRFSKYNNNIIQIPVLVDENMIEKFDHRIKTLVNNSIFRIGFTGSVSLKKEGFDTFFQALSLLKNDFSIELHLSGPISNNENELILDTLPKELNIKNIIVYHGIINHSDLSKFLNSMHLLILPRPKNEQTNFGLSTKLGEYLLSGVPTLVTAVSDNAKYIKDGINGFIVEPGSVMELKNKIKYIILNYNSLTVQDEAIKTALTQFNIKSYSKSLNHFFNNV